MPGDLSKARRSVLLPSRQTIGGMKKSNSNVQENLQPPKIPDYQGNLDLFSEYSKVKIKTKHNLKANAFENKSPKSQISNQEMTSNPLA